MARLSIVLLLAVIASALYLVRVQYDSRRLYMQIEKAQAEARKIESDRERLLAEKRGQATPLRVEQLAKSQLQMRPAAPGITQYVTQGNAPALEGGKMSAAPSRLKQARAPSGGSEDTQCRAWGRA